MPTVDIHMNQFGFDEEWLHFLKVYISPIQQRAYEGYYSDVSLAACLWPRQC